MTPSTISIRRLALVAAGACLGFASLTAAQAQDAAGGKGGRAAEMQKRFAAADKNGDGKLTKDEAQAGMPFVYKHFDEIDAAKSGAVSMADIAAFARAKHDARKSAS